LSSNNQKNTLADATAERAVLGAILVSDDVLEDICTLVSADDFYYPSYGQIFNAMVETKKSYGSVDNILLRKKAQEMKLDGRMFDDETLLDILDATPTSTVGPHYAKIVKEKSQRRTFIELCNKFAQLGYDESQSPAMLTQNLKTAIDAADIVDQSEYLKPFYKHVLEALRRIETIQMENTTLTGLPTGFTELDRKTTGLQKGTLNLIAARPGMGKTAFIMNMMYRMALGGVHVGFFSLEMTCPELMQRYIAMGVPIELSKLKTGDLQDRDWEAIITSPLGTQKPEIWIDDRGGISIEELEMRATQMKKMHNIDILFVDYLQLLSASSRNRGDNRQNEVSTISRRLKAISKNLDIPVVSLSQLSRAVEQRPDKRPVLSDLRESGAIEQDADIVMFLYRDSYYNEDTEFGNDVSVIIAKQRQGELGTVTLDWNGSKMLFTDKQPRPRETYDDRPSIDYLTRLNQNDEPAWEEGA